MTSVVDFGALPRPAPAIGGQRLLAAVPWPVLFALLVFLVGGIAGIVLMLVPSLQSLVFRQSLMKAFTPPLRSGMLLGADQLGRALEWRLLAGLGISLAAAAAVTFIATAIGLTMGIIGGFFGRTADHIVTVITDLTWAYPTLLFAVVIAGIIGPGVMTVVWALGLTFWAALARIVRAQVLVLGEQDFVLAARALGYGRVYIAFRHLLPNLIPTVIVMATLFVALTIVSEAALSFIGLGAQSPTPSLGKTLAEGFSFVSSSPWPLIFGSVTIVALIITLNAFGDRLRDVLDPKGQVPTPRRLAKDLTRRPASAAILPTESANYLVAAEHVSVAIISRRGGPVEVVSDLSLRLRPGETLGIIGESGSGKSVGARAITGLLPTGLALEAGRVLWDGIDVASFSPSELRDRRGRFLALAFQDARASLDPLCTIGAQITESLQAHFPGSRRSFRPRVLETLTRVGLSDPTVFYDRYPHQLSGGQLQRAALAAILVLEPKLLIADEPTTGLDTTTQKKIVELVKSLQRETGMAIIWISHDLNLVGEIADQVVVTYAGQAVEIGAVDDVLKDPAHPYTLDLLESRPQMSMIPKSMLRSISGTVPEPGDWPSACRFAPRCSRVLPACGSRMPELGPLAGRGMRLVRCINPELPAAGSAA